jgi:ankyrin repeat protein
MDTNPIDLTQCFRVAVSKQDILVAEHFLETGYVQQEALNESLIYTAEKGSFKIVKLLLAAGADVNALNEDGTTALMKVAWSGI